MTTGGHPPPISAEVLFQRSAAQLTGGVIMQKFIVIQQHAWSNDHGYGIGYSSDLERFDKREVAISHGFEVAGCDDFNIGVIADGRLVSLDWMEKPVGNGKGVSVEKLQIISDAIGLEAS